MEGLNILGAKKPVKSNPPIKNNEWKTVKNFKDTSSRDKFQHKTPEIFDNYIDTDAFAEIKHQVVYSDAEMEFCSYVTGIRDDSEEILKREYDSKWSWCLRHRIFDLSQSDSPLFPILHNALFVKMSSPPEYNLKALHKCYVIAYPNTENIKENLMYHDYHWNVKTGVLFLNTCDGYIKFKDGTKVNSVENRMVMFDGSNPYCLSSTTNEKLMYTININFL